MLLIYTAHYRQNPELAFLLCDGMSGHLACKNIAPPISEAVFFLWKICMGPDLTLLFYLFIYLLTKHYIKCNVQREQDNNAQITGTNIAL